MPSSSHESQQPPLALSVVVACADHADSLDRCLVSLEKACAGIECEIIVVFGGRDASVSEISSRHSGVKSIAMPSGTLVPVLWSEGIAASSGNVVALTISQCSASLAWAPALLRAISEGAAAAGGPLSLEPAASASDAAVFFLRYSAFLSGRSQSVTGEIAGDNCAYSRAALEVGGWNRDSGFWEIEVNRRLRDRKMTIAWVPEAVMEFGDAGSMSDNVRRRFVHGRHFGARRKAGRGESSFRIALASPLVPFVLFARASRRAWPNKRYRKRLMTSVPAFAILSASWALGEAVGAIGDIGANRS